MTIASTRFAYTDDLDDALDDLSWDEEDDEPGPLDEFIADGTIVEVLRELKSGKEGTVFACRANSATGGELLAAKVYRSRHQRNFKNDAVYLEGRSFGKHRENRAVKNKTRKGREIKFSAWLGKEWDTLSTLFAAGADVPRPISRGGSALLMELIGDADRAAPALQGVRLRPEQVRPLFYRLVENIELFLRCNYIHGDLSPYNILYWNEGLTIIDFPQAVDPRSNTSALELLTRDIDRCCAYFMRYGLNVDPYRITQHLWGRFLRMEL